MDKARSKKGATQANRRRRSSQGPASATPGHKARQPARIAVVLQGAERIGLLHEKDGRIASRVSSRLVKQAKERTGLSSDSELLAFALANVALEDDFGFAFAAAGGKVDPDLDIEF